MANENQDKRTASQKISDLERGLMSMYQAFDAVTRDLNTTKEALKILGNKAESIVQIVSRGDALNDESLSTQMLANNVAELKSKVDELVQRGLLSTAEAVGENTFLVGQEVDDAGKVVNPRLQFALGAISPELQEKLKGKKAGETVVLQEGKLSFAVSEVYTIVQQGQAEAPVSEEPAQEQAGTDAAAGE